MSVWNLTVLMVFTTWANRNIYLCMQIRVLSAKRQGEIPAAVPPAEVRRYAAPGLACSTHREDLSKSTFKFRRKEFMRSLHSLSVVQCRVLGSLLGINIYTENFHTVREQGGENRIYLYKGKKIKTLSIIFFFLGDDQKPRCFWANC